MQKHCYRCEEIAVNDMGLAQPHLTAFLQPKLFWKNPPNLSYVSNLKPNSDFSFSQEFSISVTWSHSISLRKEQKIEIENRIKKLLFCRFACLFLKIIYGKPQ